MINEITHLCEEIQKNEKIRIMIITGGGTAFCAGGNIKDMYEKKGIFAGDAAQVNLNYRMTVQRIPIALLSLDIPVIAAVNGAAIGAGCDLACMCDLRIASDKAHFAETYGAVGLVSGVGGAFLLTRIVGFSKASEMMLTCRTVKADEALNIGLVNEVVPPERLARRCTELAQSIANQSRTALRLTKRLLFLAQHFTLDQTLELSAAYQAMCHHTHDHAKMLKDLVKK